MRLIGYLKRSVRKLVVPVVRCRILMDLGNGWLCILMGYLGTSSFERGYIVLNDRLLMNKELGTSGKRKIVTRF